MPDGQPTLTVALELLRGRDDVLKRLLSGRVLVWLGSGISRSKFPGVPELLRRLIEELRVRAERDGAPYREALEQILRLAAWSAVDFSLNSSTWPEFDRLVAALQERYADVLSIPLPGMGGDAIVWRILELPNQYGDREVTYDVEHRLIAILVAEGVLQELITTNWDGLVEQAYAASLQSRPLHVIACVEELDGARPPTLFKIHGCAVRALDDEPRYRPYIVATRQHIQAWRDSNDPGRGAFRERVRTLLQQQHSIVLGLSFQDDNLASQFGIAREQNPAVWKRRPPRVVFSKPAPEFPQQSLLQNVFGAEDYANDAATLNQQAIVPMWAAPFLTALYFSCLRAKLLCFVDRATPGEITDAQRLVITQGLDHGEARACRHFDAVPDASRWSSFSDVVTRTVSRFLCVLRQGTVPESDTHYCPITDRDLQSMAADPHVPTLAYHRIVLVIAALLLGDQQLRWEAQFPLAGGGNSGLIRIRTVTEQYRLFVVDVEADLAGLQARAFVNVDEDSDAILFIVRGTASDTTASKRGLPQRSLGGRARAQAPLRIALEDHLRRDDARADVVAHLAGVLGLEA